MHPMHLVVSADNEVGLAWLESALEYAFARGEMVLLAYLEEVMGEVLFEMELDASALRLAASAPWANPQVVG